MTFTVPNDFTNGTTANATEVNANFTDIENQFNNSTPDYNILLQIVPIGAILPWAKSLTDVPALPGAWVECNGQTLSDADSVLNGQTIPDLNGDARFLRGSSTSGTEQADTFKSHLHSIPTTSTDGQGGIATGSNTGMGGYSYNSGSTGDSETRPINYSVVWIMRVK